MAKVGPGASIQEDVSPDPLLQGASEYEYITLHNPLPDDFVIQVAQSRPVQVPVKINSQSGVQSESDIKREYGLDLRNPDHQSRAHILNQTVIPAGGSINLPGDVAQVAIRQLVNEILQRTNKKKLADPTERRKVEESIIKKRGSVQDLMDNDLKPIQSQAREAINQSNEVNDEFPGLKDQSQEGGASNIGINSESEKKRVGRPKKAN